jgi:hypothetical protein
VAQAAELNAKLARTIIRAMRNVLEIMALSSSLFLAYVRLSSPEFPFAPKAVDIVRSIPVRVNVKRFATRENILLWVVVPTSRLHSLNRHPFDKMNASLRTECPIYPPVQ